ncbi:MAG: LytR C-terminal domain-containing protein, partial [Spirochaetota bacterium]
LLEGIRLYFFAPIRRINPHTQKHYIYNAGEQYLDGDQSHDFLYISRETVDYDEYLDQAKTGETDLSQKLIAEKSAEQQNSVLRQKNLRYTRELLLGIVSALQKYHEERETYISLLYSYFQTDLSKRSFRKLLLYMSEIDVKNAEVIFQDYLGKERMVQNKQINFPVYDGQVIRSQVVRISTQLHTLDKIVAEEYPVRVEILNGTNVSGLASRTGVLYSQQGFDVIHIGNADRSDYDKTVVINLHSNNLDDVRRVAELIGAENLVLQPLPGGEQAEAEVSVVLGRDFDGNRVAE